MIINVRGPNGSGKSFVVRCVLMEGYARPIYGLLGPSLPEAYELVLPNSKVPTYVLGPYDVSIGGCDRFKTVQAIIDLIETFAPKGHILFEGVITSTTYGQLGEYLERYGKKALFVYLNTSLEESLKYVESRRGRPRDDRLIKKMTQKLGAIQSTQRRIACEGKMDQITLSSDKAISRIAKLLRGPL